MKSIWWIFLFLILNFSFFSFYLLKTDKAASIAQDIKVVLPRGDF